MAALRQIIEGWSAYNASRIEARVSRYSEQDREDIQRRVARVEAEADAIICRDDTTIDDPQSQRRA